MKVGELLVVLGVDTKEYEKGMRQAEKQARETTASIERDLKESSAVAKKEASAFGDALAGAMSGLKQAAATIAVWEVASNVLQTASRMLFDFNIQMENAAIAFETLLGSTGKANQFVSDLADFAAKTPFEFQDVQEAAKKFLALSFSAGEVIPTLTAVGDAAAAMGGGAEMIDGIVMALGQMKTKGRVQAEELLQLAERGIPVYKILQEELGLTADQVANIGNMAMPADKAIRALVTGIEKRYKGMMDKMSDTTTGLLSTIWDNLKMIGGQLLGGAFGNLKDSLKSIRDYLNDIVDTVRRGGIKAAFEKFVPEDMQEPILFILGSVKKLGEALKNLWTAAKPILSFMVKVGLVAANFLLPILTGVINIVADLLRFLQAMVNGVLRLLGVSTEKANAWFASLTEGLKNIWRMDFQLPEPDSKAMEDFADATGEAGKETKDATKEMKKFLAAFDEVYQVTEDENEELDQFGDLANLLPSVVSPEPFEPPSSPEPTRPSGVTPITIIPTNVPPVPSVSPSEVQPVIDEFIRLWDTINEILERLKKRLEEWEWPALPELPGLPELVNNLGEILERLKQRLREFQWPPWPEWPPIPLPRLGEAWQAILEAINKAWDWLKEKAGELLGGLEPVLKPAIALIDAFSLAWQTALGLVSEALQSLKATWDMVTGGISQAMESFRKWAEETWGRLAQGLQAAWQVVIDIAADFQKAWQSAKDTVWRGWEELKGAARGVAEAIKSPFEPVVSFLQSVVGLIEKAVKKVKSWKGWGSWGESGQPYLSPGIPSGTVAAPGVGAFPVTVPSMGTGLVPIPAFADGGIVTAPTVGLIGERGDEAVVPLDEGGIINYERLADAIVAALQQSPLTAVMDSSKRTLTKLERALQPIRTAESNRIGGA